MAGIVMESQQSYGLENSNVTFQESVEYEKILKLRDTIVAGTHPRLKLASKTASIVPPSKISSPPRQDTQQVNGISTAGKKQPTIPLSIPAPTIQAPACNAPATSAVQSTSTKFNHNTNAGQKTPAQILSSGLDPIFLEKGESLIKAESRLERQRIEHDLEAQVRQRHATARERACHEEAVPDFDVTEVLHQAQELVKPVVPVDSQGANGVPSSSDSFDDNTFYSSQMNDSTPDEVDDRPKRRTTNMTKPCKFFFEGSCKKGDACTFSHDSAFKQKLQADVSLTMELDSDSRIHPQRRLRGDQRNDETRRSSIDFQRDIDSDAHGQEPGPGQGHANLRDRPYHHSRDSGEIFEEPQAAPANLPRPRSKNRHRYNLRNNPMERNYSHQEPGSPREPNSASKKPGRASPNARDVTIVRNHITSPVAPQPARVSPLAVAKVPRLDQIRQGEQENYNPRSPRQTASAQHSAQHSPLLVSQPINSRKRRRERDLAESGRNVAPRRDLDSPMPYIKDEPVSPPPFTELSVPQHSRYEPVGRQSLFIESTPPHANERVVYERRYPEPSHVRVSDFQRTSTPAPIVRRVISRAGHHYEIQEEPEVRQVYSARQPLRVRSPQQDLGHYSAPQAKPIRAVSRAMIVRPEADPQKHHRASIQPQTIAYNRVGGPTHDRSLSPELRMVSQYSPPGREVVPMAPPSRRIVMDQYGQKYYEAAPIVAERRASVAPLPQRYVSEQVNSFTFSERPAPRRASVRPQTGQAFDAPGYVRAVHSPGPTSPSYMEYYRAPEPLSAGLRQRVYEPQEEIYHDDRNEVVRVIEYPPEKRLVEYPSDRRIAQAPRYEEITMPREAPIQRMQSVRPSGSQYELTRERVPRGQTVQPERIIDLDGRHDTRAPMPASARQVSDGYVPAATRQFSLKTENGYEHVRTPTYIPMQGQRPRYQYVSEGREQAGFSQDGLYESEVVVEEPRSGGRRGLQRL